MHNGSAPASQAGSVGSIPITCSKKKDTPPACLSFWVPPPRGRLHPSVIEMPGGSKPRLAPQALPAAKHSYGAKAPRPEGRSGGSVPAYPFHNPYFKISVLTVLCTSEWTALHSKSPAVWPGFFHTAPLFLLFPTKFCWRKLPRVPRGPWPGEISVLTLLCKPEP